MTNPTILYWKWDESIFEETVFEAKLLDILQRSSFTLIYVSFHHLPRRFDDPKLLELIGRCARRLEAAGRRMLLDIDVRNETESFLARYPLGKSFRLCFLACTLDEMGTAVLSRNNPVRGRTGRSPLCNGPTSLAGAWAFHPAGEGLYIPDTLSAVDCRFSDKGHTTIFEILTDSSQAHKQVLIAALYEAPVPDLASEELFAYYDYLFSLVKDLPLGGVANDEWGYDLSLRWNDGLFSVDEFPYTATLAADYEKTTDHSFNSDCIHMAVAPDGSEGETLAVVNQYTALLRTHMKRGNDWFYNAGKRHFGQHCFIGVHPTLWGDPSDFSMDIPHNGICWWEVKRDYAQTDEFVPMSVRLALAHRWSQTERPVFYNMWYSGNTQQFDTYLEETWTNARFGGRTHYLSYECPNESGVYQLKHPGDLERIEEMEHQIARLDLFQCSLPDSRVLVLFGMESVSNWMLNQKGPRIVRGQGALPAVLRHTAALFEHYLCDLVPTSEVIGGDVRLENGCVNYGSQSYDAVIVLAPTYMDSTVLEFLRDYHALGGHYLIVGDCRYESDGTDTEVLSGMSNCLPEQTSVGYLMSQLQQWDIPANRSVHGCVFQDGSLIYTATGRLPSGNVLCLEETLGGHAIRFFGEDFLGLRFDSSGQLCEYTAGQIYELTVDGVSIMA